MKRNRDLESRLVEWGKEYGGGRYENNGWPGLSPMAVVVRYHGRAPQGLNQRNVISATPADEVQEAIAALERQGQGWLPAKVICAEYLTPAQPIEMKLQRLRAIGENLSRVRYYQHLRLARVHVAGWLHIPFCDLEEAA